MPTYTVILWITGQDGRQLKQAVNGVQAGNAADAQAQVIAKLEAAGVVHGDVCRVRRTDIGA